MAKRHRHHGVPVSALFAPTMISNGSSYDPFDSGGGEETTEEATEVAVEALESGETQAEAVATVMEETGASPKEALKAVKEAKEEIKEKGKRGRKPGSKNKPKETTSVSSAANKAEKKAPKKIGNISEEKLPKEIKDLLPSGCYVVKSGLGKAAYCPSTGKKYSLKTGAEQKPVGRHSDSGSAKSSAKTSAKTSAKKTSEASGKPRVDKSHKVAKAVAELAQLTGLKLAPSFRVDYGDYQRKGPAVGKKRELVLKENSAEQAKLGPYTLTLLKNPLTDFSVAGVKVVPTVVGTAGVLTLEKFVERVMPYVPGWDNMQAGPVKSAAPSIAVMALSALGHWYASKNDMKMLAEATSAMFGFGFVLATSKVVDQYVEKAVSAVAPAASATTVAKVEQKPTSGGMFAESRGMSGGAFVSPSMSGYLARQQSSGYPTPQLGVSGSTGYPPVQLNGKVGAADSVALAKALSGGAFAHASSAGHDTSDLKDF